MNNARERALQNFRLFNEHGGKFRVAVVNVCNLDCFFCHNEAMANPRREHAAAPPLAAPALRAGAAHLDDAQLVAMINAFTSLGGRQVNITGGEPLAHPALVALLERIDKRGTRVILNTNAILADRLLARPRVANLDGVFASLHTTDDAVFRAALGGRGRRGAASVMAKIAALKAHGYDVQVNYSLGGHNRDGFDAVLDFTVERAIDLKAIALVRSSDAPGFYGEGDWVDPAWLDARLAARGAERLGESEGFGGHVTSWRVGSSTVKVKNIARGRLETDFCKGCLHRAQCGEGIYGLRVGVDALMKPCLMRREKFRAYRPDEDPGEQILAMVDAMVGDWTRARFVGGPPQ